MTLLSQHFAAGIRERNDALDPTKWHDDPRFPHRVTHPDLPPGRSAPRHQVAAERNGGQPVPDLAEGQHRYFRGLHLGGDQQDVTPPWTSGPMPERQYAPRDLSPETVIKQVVQHGINQRDRHEIPHDNPNISPFGRHWTSDPDLAHRFAFDPQHGHYRDPRWNRRGPVNAAVIEVHSSQPYQGGQSEYENEGRPPLRSGITNAYLHLHRVDMSGEGHEHCLPSEHHTHVSTHEIPLDMVRQARKQAGAVHPDLDENLDHEEFYADLDTPQMHGFHCDGDCWEKAAPHHESADWKRVVVPGIDWKSRTPGRHPIPSSLEAKQDFINPGVVDHYRHGGDIDPDNSGEHPAIFKWKGKHWVDHGTHRLAAAMANGETHYTGHYHDLDAEDPQRRQAAHKPEHTPDHDHGDHCEPDCEIGEQRKTAASDDVVKRYTPAPSVSDLLASIGGNRPAPAKADPQAEDDRARRIREHKEWQAKRPGLNPGDHIGEHQMGKDYPTAEWVPIGVAQRFRDHTGDQHEGSEQTVHDLHQQLASGRGLTDPLMLHHHNEAGFAHLGEGNHRLVAMERDGWSHVPMRVVRMYDGEVADNLHLPDKKIPEHWMGDHVGRTPDVARPSQVFNFGSKEYPGSREATRREGHRAEGPGLHQSPRRLPRALARLRRLAGGASRAGDGGVGPDRSLSVEWHPKAIKDMKRFDKPTQRQIASTIESLRTGDANVQSHWLRHPLKDWQGTKASRGHRIVNQTRGDTLYIGAVSLHEYEEAERRFGSVHSYER